MLINVYTSHIILTENIVRKVITNVNKFMIGDYSTQLLHKKLSWFLN